MAKLSSKQRKCMSSSMFGLPSKKMFPMPDKTHVIQAERFLSRAKISSSEKAQVKRKIASRKKALGMTKKGKKK